MRFGTVASSVLAAHLAVSNPISTAAFAADLANGKAVFELKCAACHEYGGNAINPMKNLQQASLDTNGYKLAPEIMQLIANGKGQMPSYGPKAPSFARLSDEAIADVAEYVLDQAAKGWPK